MSLQINRLSAVVALLVLLVGTPVTAQLADEVGVYFDTGYTVTEVFDETVPHVATAYLVLHSPTQTAGGLGGWECRLAFPEYQPSIQTRLAGDAMNFKTVPDFIVGMLSPLPVTGAQVLLAEFDLFINEATPFRIEMLPLLYKPSVADAMSYIPWDDKEALTPMTTVTGQRTVATYNWVPNCDVSAGTISYGQTPLNSVVTRRITVSNLGGGTLVLDPVITGDGFRVETSGPYDVPSGGTLDLVISFMPVVLDSHVGQLDLGTGCDPVALYGWGRLPITSYSFSPESWDFGTVAVDGVAVQTFTFVNDGEVPFDLDPAVDCPDFRVDPSVPFTVDPNRSRYIYVYFQPPTTGLYSCSLTLAPGINPVPLTGASSVVGDLVSVIPTAVDFGPHYPDTSPERWVRLVNESGAHITVEATLANTGTPFTLTSPLAGQTVTITANGGYHYFFVSFAPTSVGTFSNQLVFPSVGIIVPLTGEALDPTGSVVVYPSSIDYGSLYLNQYMSHSLYIQNHTPVAIDLTPVIEPYWAPFVISRGGEATSLPAGESHLVTIAFNPSSLGNHDAVFTGGPDVPPVALSGYATFSSSGIAIDPRVLDFGLRPVGSSGELEVRVINRNSYAVDMDVYLEPAGRFTLTAGASIGVVPPNSSALVRVRYAPTDTGYHSAVLHLSPDLPEVPVSGQAGNEVPYCDVSASELVFLPTPTGGGSSQLLTITNTGSAPLVLDPSFNCSEFLTVTGADTVAVGESMDLTVLYMPENIGTHTCILDLGPESCGPITLAGEAFVGSPVGSTEDLVGVYFDQGFTQPFISDLEDQQIFESYLVLKAPSVPDDLSGWELQMLLPEGVVLLEDIVWGEGLNFATPPSYLVGLASPLPAMPTMHLATFTMFSVGLANDVPLALVPKRNPSLPDAMAVSSGSLHELRPIFPESGQPVVALLNYTGTVAIEALTAEITADGSVVLNWPLPNRAGATNRLWRRDPSGHEELLTDDPALVYGNLLTWTDRPTGFAPGTVLGYSFAVVSGGTEVYHSPRTEVTLPGAVALATRLLPNVPNPFNPETSVRFELARPGRVRINVYDVAGRRVARLLDESRIAGPGQVVWRGRNDAGRTVPSAAYYIRLEADGRVDTRKVLLLK